MAIAAGLGKCASFRYVAAAETAAISGQCRASWEKQR